MHQLSRAYVHAVLTRRRHTHRPQLMQGGVGTAYDGGVPAVESTVGFAGFPTAHHATNGEGECERGRLQSTLRGKGAYKGATMLLASGQH